MGSLDKLFRTGKSSAKRAAREQKALLAKQQQLESIGLAEEEDEIARRLALASGKTGGRRSLIRTSEVGLSNREQLG